MEENKKASLISVEDGYARFAPTGFVTHLSIVGLIERAMIECQERGQTRLLVDLRATEHAPLSGVDRYELGAALADVWDRSLLLALVVRPDQLDPERFGQRVAHNRGLFYGQFTELPLAQDWLKRPRESKSA